MRHLATIKRGIELVYIHPTKKKIVVVLDRFVHVPSSEKTPFPIMTTLFYTSTRADVNTVFAKRESPTKN